MPFIPIIHQKSIKEGLDLQTAAAKFSKELDDYRELGRLQNAVRILNEQVSSISTFNSEQQHAIMTLMNMKSIGYNERDIKELLRHVNDGRRTASDIWVD